MVATTQIHVLGLDIYGYGGHPPAHRRIQRAPLLATLC
jgi:hypothetical protein